MSRLLWALSVVAAFLLSAVNVVAADVADNGPPYTDEQFLDLSMSRLPTEFRRGDLKEWWSRAPAYLRKRVLSAPSEMWWPIIECNYMGFTPEGMGVGGADKCEKDAYKGLQRGKASWTADGQWIGPSEECRKRDKRSQWGELICD